MSGAPITVGFIGAGNVLPAYLQTLDRLVPQGLAAAGPVCARRPEARESLRAHRPGTVCVAAADEVLGDAGVDLVVILTPPASHAGLVRAALQAGKHVVCEKPVAAAPEEAAALYARANSVGRLLLAAPFVQLSPSLRRLWTLVADGRIGQVHSARAHYGNAGSDWAPWYHSDPLATLQDVGVYNLKSLCALLGPVAEVTAASARSARTRAVAGEPLADPAPDTWQLVLRHHGGALSSVLASQATARYRRPALELYGTEGTANLLGDDWDPAGVEVWEDAAGAWTLHEPEDTTWLWTDGLREAVSAILGGRDALADPALDIHVLDVIAAAARSADVARSAPVHSTFAPFEALRLGDGMPGRHVHDRTRPAEAQ